MSNKDKKKIILSLYNSNSNKSDKIKLLLKSFRKQYTSKNIQSPKNTNYLSSNPSFLKNLNIKHTYSIKRNKNYKKEDITTIKINQTTNNKYININYSKDINDKNITTIYSNGKFRNTKQKLKNTIRKKLYEKNIILSNHFINNKLNKLNKKLSLKITSNSNNKNNFNNKWKGLNISSHYIGNTKDNQFGIITNKFCVNKNIILTCSHNNLKFKQKYGTTSIIIKRNNKNKIKNKEFRTINIPNHNNYFNGIGTTNFFPGVKNVINNEKLYKKLMEQMTVVFNNKVKEYSLHKSNEKNTNISSSHSDYFRKGINSIKMKKLYNYEYKIGKINNDNKNIYQPINIKNSSNRNSNINIKLNQNESND